MDNLIMFVVFGVPALWLIAWLIAFMSASYTVLQGMISSTGGEKNGFTLWGLWRSFLCAALALIPLFVFLLLRARFEATFPG